MGRNLIDYLALVSDHSLDMEILPAGPAIVDYIPCSRPGFHLPDIASLCLPRGTTKGITKKRHNKALIPAPSYHISSFVQGGDSLYLGCMRFTQLINRESGNSLWNAIRPKEKSPITTTHVNYSICVLSHYPMFSYMYVLLSYILQVYIRSFHIPNSSLLIPSCFSLPLQFPNVKAHCSFSSFIETLLSMQALVPGTMKEFQLPDITFPLIPSNSALLPGMADFVLSTCLTRCPLDLLMEALKYCLTDRKVAFLSSDLSLLSMTLETVRTLLFPFQWRPPFVFLSIFQLDYLSVLQSPMPFLLGLPRDFLADATVARACRSVLLVDVDNQALIPPVSSRALAFPSQCLYDLHRRWSQVVPKPVSVRRSQNRLQEVFSEDVARWRSTPSSAHVSLDACDLPVASPLLPEYDVYDLLTIPWIDKARTLLLEFFFQLLGDYESFLWRSSRGDFFFNTVGYLRSRGAARGGLLDALVHGQLFLAHVHDIARPDADEWKPFLAAKRAFLADGDYAHAHATLFLLCRRDVAAIRSRLRNATPTEGDDFRWEPKERPLLHASPAEIPPFLGSLPSFTSSDARCVIYSKKIKETMKKRRLTDSHSHLRNDAQDVASIESHSIQLPLRSTSNQLLTRNHSISSFQSDRPIKSERIFSRTPLSVEREDVSITEPLVLPSVN
ncbi:hypothetical protein WA588_005240 [Blastocystis sp. NMH]